MVRLHTETIPTSTLASTARVVDGFVTTQSDHSGISSSFTRAYTATGITRTAKDGIWYTYGWNLTKKAPDGCKGDWTNTQLLPEGARSREAAPSQVFGSDGYIKTAYTYTPYGSVTASGNVTQPIQWSSEYNDTELGLVYYNYRHYNPADGRWIGRDPLFSMNRYLFSSTLRRIDFLGLIEMLNPVYKEVPFIRIPDSEPKKSRIRLGMVSIRIERAPSMEKREKECCLIVKATKFWLRVEVLEKNSPHYHFNENQPSTIDPDFLDFLNEVKEEFSREDEKYWHDKYTSPDFQASYEGVKIHEKEHMRILLNESKKIGRLLENNPLIHCSSFCADIQTLYEKEKAEHREYPEGDELLPHMEDILRSQLLPLDKQEVQAVKAEMKYYIKTLLK